MNTPPPPHPDDLPSSEARATLSEPGLYDDLSPVDETTELLVSIEADAMEGPTRVAYGTTPAPIATTVGPAPVEPTPAPTAVSAFVGRSRVYCFVLDERGNPIELGSGRFAKCYLGEERWVESKTACRRLVAIKALQAGVPHDVQRRFQQEKEILERVQGHPNVVQILASGEGENPHFIPPALRDRIDNDYLVLELLDMSLEERLKGSRNQRRRDDLLALSTQDRLFHVLDYVIPVATAVEHSHLVCNTVHRDIKPANVLLKLPDPALRGSMLQVKLADFNVAKLDRSETVQSTTRSQSVPGTLYFQSPEQEINVFELLVNVEAGSPEVEFFEDFYTEIHENDVFALFNRNESYNVASADRGRKRLILDSPYQGPSETNVRAQVTKSVGRPADVYSLGGFFYYLFSGASANPKSLHDAFRKFIEWDKKDESNTVEAYIDYEYKIIQNLRAPKDENGDVSLAPDDRFFSYKHYLDGNGTLIDQGIMTIIAKAMIRNKPDSYCQSWDLRTCGVSQLVDDLYALYLRHGVDPSARAMYAQGHTATQERRGMRRALDRVADRFRRR